MTARKLIVGTRGSKLALVQTELVITALTAAHPEITTEVKIITTTGDLTQAKSIPLDDPNKDWFTREIEQELESGDIDLAVHSLKDLPPDSPTGLTTAAVLERGDPRDVLVSSGAPTLADLQPGAIVGTGSSRRRALLLHRQPDLTVKNIRGNVDTRLRKLHEGQYDAVVLALVGLERLGLGESVTEFFDPESFVPAAGQGTLAVEARTNDATLWEILHSLQHQPTLTATAAELAFIRVFGGGCKQPIGCYVRLDGDTAHLFAMVGSEDGRQVNFESAAGPATQAVTLAEDLANKLLRQSFTSQR